MPVVGAEAMVKILADARAAEDTRLRALTPQERAEYQRELQARFERVAAKDGPSWERIFRSREGSDD